MQITYQKKDGCIFQKYRTTMLPYKIGDTTSMGWKVLNIEYEYEGNYYPENEFNKLIQKHKQSSLKKIQNIELCKSEFKKFMYYFIAALIIKFITIFIGV